MSSTSSIVDTPETQLTAEEENRHRAMGHTAFRWLTMLLIGVAAAAGIAFASPGHADAAVANCTKVDCTVYLSKSETRALANGRIPAPPGLRARAGSGRVLRLGGRPQGHRGPVCEPGLVLGVSDHSRSLEGSGVRRIQVQLELIEGVAQHLWGGTEPVSPQRCSGQPIRFTPAVAEEDLVGCECERVHPPGHGRAGSGRALLRCRTNLSRPAAAHTDATGRGPARGVDRVRQLPGGPTTRVPVPHVSVAGKSVEWGRPAAVMPTPHRQRGDDAPMSPFAHDFPADEDEPLLMVAVHTDGPVTVLRVRGDLDMLTAPSLRTAARDVLTGEPAAVVVDVTEVTFLASVGIEALLDLCRQLTPSRPFAVAASGAATARPLALLGLSEILHVTPDLPTATAHVCARLGPG